MTGLNPPTLQNLIWTDVGQLLKSLGNQATLVDHYNEFRLFSVSGLYDGKNPVKRAHPGRSASIKLFGRQKGTVVFPSDNLQAIVKSDNQDLIWTD